MVLSLSVEPSFLVVFTTILSLYAYADRKLRNQFIANFSDFLHQNPGVLWVPQLLQQKLKMANLGIHYWDKKMEQYRVIRENLGVKLV